ncbi:nitrilase-related carbon-nitrogen hydrolase [Bengtsoniella intestinalis]|uniref:nitrilase-related carbon-nitrogen hydrolase n=1 Tax=Bengtsoniella intestinalis TaxID=3073143 RepID=UPI00391EFFCB
MKSMILRACTALFFMAIVVAVAYTVPHPSQTAITASALTSPAFAHQQTVAQLLEPTPLPEADVVSPTDSTDPTPATLIELSPILYQQNALAVVNFKATWGNKSANIATMTDYIYEADAQGAQMIVFPEMALIGYSANSDSETWDYQMPVAYAETTAGTTATTFSALAQELDLWIIYGGTETYSSTQAYNAAFICSPDGSVETYRKIAPVEGDWCLAGSAPLVIDAGDLGRIGIGICYDTYSHPELGEYYTSQGCDLYVNLTASSVNYSADNEDAWLWYYTSRLESLAAQSGLYVASANLVGSCGGYVFPGGSAFVTPNTAMEVTTGEEGIVYNQAMDDLPSLTINATTYSQWYADIAATSYNPKYSYTSAKSPTVYLADTTATLVSTIHQAGAQGVDILLYPSEDFITQPIPGTTTRTLSNYAVTYEMYILFTMTEILDSGEEVDAVAILSPDGTITSHQVDSPVILDTPWGSLGVALGDELYNNPLLSRYYGAMGCKGMLHIGFTAPTTWQLETILGVYGSRDGLAIATCTPTQSHLVTIFHNQSGDQAINWETGAAVDWTAVTEPTLWNLEDTGFSITYFNAERSAQWFDSGAES